MEIVQSNYRKCRQEIWTQLNRLGWVATFSILFCASDWVCLAADPIQPQAPAPTANPSTAIGTPAGPDPNLSGPNSPLPPDSTLNSGQGPPPGPEEKTKLPDSDDYSTSPFTEYGEFNQSRDEETDSQFLQFGRFFGISVGLGIEAADGNRGLLWQGGFPMVYFKVHYWFDFNLALNIGFYTASHYFTIPGTGQVNISMFRAGLDLKYYINTKDLSSTITFASPYFLVGVGAFSKSEYVPTVGATPTTLTSMGVSAGAGLEFTLSPKKTYIELEGKMNYVPFYDSGSTAYLASKNIPNLNGNFWTISSSLLLTW